MIHALAARVVVIASVIVCLGASIPPGFSKEGQRIEPDAGLKAQIESYRHGNAEVPQLKIPVPASSYQGQTESSAASKQSPVEVNVKDAQNKLSIPTVSGAAGSEDANKKHFSGIFYINRDVDKLRRENMERALSDVDRQTTRVVRLQAVNADEVEMDAEFHRLMPMGCCTNTAAHKCLVAKATYEQGMRSCACDFMHRKAYQRIAESPDGYYLVLEDDIDLKSSDWEEKAMAYLEDAPKDWDMLRIGYWGDTHPDDQVPSSPGWLRAFRDRGKYPAYRGYYGAHAVVLTPGRAKKLVELMTQYYGDFADRFTKDGSFGDSYINSYVTTAPVIGLGKEFGSTRNDGIVTLNTIQTTPTSQELSNAFGFDAEELSTRTLR